MYIKSNLAQHSAIALSGDILKICKKFLHYYNLTFFTYLKILSPNEFIILITNPDWFKYFIENEFVIQSGKMLKTGMHMWQGTHQNEVIKMGKEFNIKNGLFVVQEFPTYTESCIFAGPSNRIDLINFYLNHSQTLKQFIYYFRNKAKPLIEGAEYTKVYLLNPLKNYDNSNIPSYFDNEKKTKYSLIHNNQEVILSYRELTCLKLFCQNMTAKQTANTLNLAPKTVEFYLYNIRQKINYQNKNDFVKLMIDNSLF